MTIRMMVDDLGRRTMRGVEEFGYTAMLFAESLYFIIVGRFRNESVRLSAVAREITKIGVDAIGIASMLCFAVGIMLAIQGIETLKTYGAESKVVIGIALSVTREFSPLIISILVAGRSGSAITARIGTMVESQEIDALRVIGVNPVRYLAAPIVLAMLIAVPALTVLGNFMGILGGGIYSALELQIPLTTYFDRTLDALVIDDIRQGLIKSVVFAVIISMVGITNGFQVKGGAEGVGRATTRSVVLSITFIVLADMVFTYFLNK